MKTRILFLILITTSLTSCKEKQVNKRELEILPKIINFENEKKFKRVSELKLDSLHPNLLDNRNADKKEMQDVINSWKTYHKEFSLYLKECGFKWDVVDSTITVMNKIYFDKNGNLKHHIFKTLNSNISKKKKEEYEKLLNEFSVMAKIELTRDYQFAQCGKVTYKNY